MKKADVQLGRDYFVKVSGQIKTVRLIGVHPLGGYTGRVLQTDRIIRIKTAARLRGLRNDSPGGKCVIRRTDVPNEPGIARFYRNSYGTGEFWGTHTEAARVHADLAHKVLSMLTVPAVVEVL